MRHRAERSRRGTGAAGSRQTGEVRGLSSSPRPHTRSSVASGSRRWRSHPRQSTHGEGRRRFHRGRRLGGFRCRGRARVCFHTAGPTDGWRSSSCASRRPILRNGGGASWSVATGEVERDEDLLDAAHRVFSEEIGLTFRAGPAMALYSGAAGPQASWSMFGRSRRTSTPPAIRSNSFLLPWPPRSGQVSSSGG